MLLAYYIQFFLLLLIDIIGRIFFINFNIHLLKIFQAHLHTDSYCIITYNVFFRLMDIAKEMTRESLPIKCLEAVILGMYPSLELDWKYSQFCIIFYTFVYMKSVIVEVTLYLKGCA